MMKFLYYEMGVEKIYIVSFNRCQESFQYNRAEAIKEIRPKLLGQFDDNARRGQILRTKI